MEEGMRDGKKDWWADVGGNEGRKAWFAGRRIEGKRLGEWIKWGKMWRGLQVFLIALRS